MNRHEYRAHPALNFSSAKYLLDSPADYQAHIAAPRIESAARSLEDQRLSRFPTDTQRAG